MDGGQFEPRRAEQPKQVFEGIGRGGHLIKLRADDQGVVTPTTAAEKQLLDSFDLPVARAAISEARAKAAAADSDNKPEPIKGAGPDAEHIGKEG